MTSGQEMEWVYCYNPGARTGLNDVNTDVGVRDIKRWLL